MLFCLVLSFCLLNSALSMPYASEEEEDEGNELKLEDESGNNDDSTMDEDYYVYDGNTEWHMLKNTINLKLAL